MKIRLYHPGSPFTFGENLILTPPSERPPGPPEFLWMRLRFENELWGTYQYDLDGTLAVSLDPTGPIFPVRVQLELPRHAPITIQPVLCVFGNGGSYPL